MNEENKSTYVGPGFGTLLQITFIILKLCKVINWSWLWVLAPTWIGWSIVALIGIIVLIIKAFVDR